MFCDTVCTGVIPFPALKTKPQTYHSSPLLVGYRRHTESQRTSDVFCSLLGFQERKTINLKNRDEQRVEITASASGDTALILLNNGCPYGRRRSAVPILLVMKSSLCSLLRVHKLICVFFRFMLIVLMEKATKV